MQSLALFISAAPLHCRPSGISLKCRRRPRIATHSCAQPSHDPPENPSNAHQSGDPQWIELARSLGSTSESDPVRPPPQWKLPDDNAEIDENAGTAAWAAWNSAVQKPEPLYQQRDPRKETDFWRNTARDLAASSESDQQGSASVSDDGDSAEGAGIGSQASSAEIWQMARGVTGEMSNLQERLRSDLERYNPDENKDQYRDIARELVGPPNDEPWSDVAPRRKSESADGGSGGIEAEAGTGWNPDVDWMRFDDVRREQDLKSEAEWRKASLQKAEEQRKQALGGLQDKEEEDLTYVDDNGSVLSADEVRKAMQEGAMFLDESGAEIDGSEGDGEKVMSFEDGKVPGFIANRYKSGSTYGAGWSGADAEIEALQKEGIPLRDAKADVDSWRSAARELNIDVSSDCEYEESSLEESVDGEEGEEESKEGESSVWSSWRTVSEKWEKATENLAPRDAAKEVNMWRASARDLVGGDDGGDGDSDGNDGGNTDRRAWDEWRSANTKWEQSIEEMGGEEEGDSWRTRWGTESKSRDWGAGLDKKTMSERGAWDNWNNVIGSSFANDRSMWWSTRSDGEGFESGRGKEAEAEQKRERERWRGMARQVMGIESKDEEELLPRSARQKGDSSVDFWKEIAKEMNSAEGESDERPNSST